MAATLTIWVLYSLFLSFFHFLLFPSSLISSDFSHCFFTPPPCFSPSLLIITILVSFLFSPLLLIVQALPGCSLHHLSKQHVLRSITDSRSAASTQLHPIISCEGSCFHHHLLAPILIRSRKSHLGWQNQSLHNNSTLKLSTFFTRPRRRVLSSSHHKNKAPHMMLIFELSRILSFDIFPLIHVT